MKLPVISYLCSNPSFDSSHGFWTARLEIFQAMLRVATGFSLGGPMGFCWKLRHYSGLMVLQFWGA